MDMGCCYSEFHALCDRQTIYILKTFLVKNTIILPDGEYWIGGSDMMEEGTFRWMSNGVPSTVIHTDWKTGEPNNAYGYQNCIAISATSGFQWIDTTCATRAGFLCMQSINNLICER